MVKLNAITIRIGSCCPSVWIRRRRYYNSWAMRIRKAKSPEHAFCLYSKMHRNSVPFDTFSILFTLSSLSSPHNPTLIRHLHSHVLKLGFASHCYVATSLLHAYSVSSFHDGRSLFDEMPHRSIVTWNTMIAGYANSLGDVGRAYKMFEEMPVRDVASWSTMITALFDNDDWDGGLTLFRRMVVTDAKPDQVTLTTVLSGCACMGSLGLLVGKSLHGFAVKNGWDLNVEIGTVLVDMYAKCGFLKYAFRVFDLMKERNVATWTALICGAAQHGYSEEALTLFSLMQQFGVIANELTFTGVLSACVHSGSIEEGRKYFQMIDEYGLQPRIQHYGCMVDLFCKAGLLEEAFGVIKTMNFTPNAFIWSSYLSACKMHKKFEKADEVIEQVLGMIKPENDGGVYALICDIYALSGKWADAERIRNLMTDQSVRKVRGSSFIRNARS